LSEIQLRSHSLILYVLYEASSKYLISDTPIILFAPLSSIFELSLLFGNLAFHTESPLRRHQDFRKVLSPFYVSLQAKH